MADNQQTGNRSDYRRSDSIVLKKKQMITKTVSAIMVGVLVVFGLVTLFLSMMFSAIFPDYPVIKKQINDQYYFTQQEYGWVTSMPGKHVYIYRNRLWWFDKEVGYIDKFLDTGDLDIKITAAKGSKVRLSLFSGQSLEMDTVIDPEKQYLEISRSYRDWHKQKE